MYKLYFLRYVLLCIVSMLPFIYYYWLSQRKNNETHTQARNLTSMSWSLKSMLFVRVFRLYKKRKKKFAYMPKTRWMATREKEMTFYDEKVHWLPLIANNCHLLSFQFSSVFHLFFFWRTTEFSSFCNLGIQFAVKKRVVAVLIFYERVIKYATSIEVYNFVECIIAFEMCHYRY
jgi:hypothetical protein